MKFKVNINTEKISNFAKANFKYLPAVGIGSIVLLFAILTYLALYTREDATHVAEGEKRLQSLDIRFNMKLLSELSATKIPTQLGTAGGRDPFSGF